MSYQQSTKLTTRSDFNAKLLFLSNRNGELEGRLRDADQSCQRYEAKINAQHALVVDLMDAIHALAASPSNKNDNASGGNIPEEMCVLLTKNARRVSELSQEVEMMKLQLIQRIQVPNIIIENSGNQSDPSEKDDDDDDDDNNVDEYEDIPSSSSTTSSVSSTSSSSYTESQEKLTQLTQELNHVNSRCESLERSFKTLKRKNMDREMRSMKSLRNMRWQISELEEERKRRLDLQITAEERVLELENELHELKQQTFHESRFRRQHQPITENQSDTDLKDVKSSTLKGVDHCRALAMLRNKVFRKSEDYFPQDLEAVSEDSGASDDSDESDDSEDECGPRRNAYLALE